MKKGIILLLSVLMIMFVFVGCGDTDDAVPDDNGEAPEEIRIALLNSLTGGFAPAGALAGHRGNLIAIDMVNEKGGVLGQYPVVAIEVDSQSDPDVALREAERVIQRENVQVIAGIFSSAIAVPVAPLSDDLETICWIHIAISDAVVKDRHQQYVFRPQPMGSQWGASTVEFVNHNYALFGVDSPQDLRVAVLHEDGPYGTSTADANLAKIEEYGMNLVFDDAYPYDVSDMTSLVIRLTEAQPDVLFHTGYYPDIVLFLRQARELGFKTQAILGHGAGHAALADVAADVGAEVVNYFFNVDPAPAQIIPPEVLDEGIAEINAEFLRRVEEEYGIDSPTTHYTQGFAHMWMLLEYVIPLAIEKYGDFSPDSIRQAALELDMPDGSTPAGYGIQFAPPEHQLSGQNLRAYPTVMQYIDGKFHIMWPEALRTETPVVPFPSDHPFGE